MKQPLLSDPLGSYANREEFQVDQTIVWVMVPDGADRAACIRSANAIFVDVWAARPAVIMCAGDALQHDMPQRGHVFDRVSPLGEHLAVWGIWLCPEDRTATYEVGINDDGDPSAYDTVSAFLDGRSCMVVRASTGELTVHIIRDGETSSE